MFLCGVLSSPVDEYITSIQTAKRPCKLLSATQPGHLTFFILVAEKSHLLESIRPCIIAGTGSSNGLADIEGWTARLLQYNKYHLPLRHPRMSLRQQTGRDPATKGKNAKSEITSVDWAGCCKVATALTGTSS